MITDFEFCHADHKEFSVRESGNSAWPFHQLIPREDLSISADESEKTDFQNGNSFENCIKLSSVFCAAHYKLTTHLKHAMKKMQ